MQTAKFKQTIWFQKRIQPARPIFPVDLSPPHTYLLRCWCVVAVEVAARLAAVRDEDERRTATSTALTAASDWGDWGLGGQPNEMHGAPLVNGFESIGLVW